MPYNGLGGGLSPQLVRCISEASYTKNTVVLQIFINQTYTAYELLERSRNSSGAMICYFVNILLTKY